MSSKLAVIAMAAALATGAAAAADPERWLHVNVAERTGEAERVSVNLPLSLVEEVLPLVNAHHFRGGKIRIEDAQLQGTDLKGIWKALRSTRDAEFVTVEGADEDVKVAKSGGFMVVKVAGHGEHPENVDVRVPLDVVDALFAGDAAELDVMAAVKALASRPDGDIVIVHDDDADVRVWIDSVASAK